MWYRPASRSLLAISIAIHLALEKLYLENRLVLGFSEQDRHSCAGLSLVKDHWDGRGGFQKIIFKGRLREQGLFSFVEIILLATTT